MSSEAPPWAADFTTSWTCLLDVEVKTFTSSGMSAPASVPQEMIADSFHHSVPSPRLLMSRKLVRNVSAIETPEVSHTRLESGRSKSISSESAHLALAITLLSWYDRNDAMTITARITKIHTRSWTCSAGWLTASRMNVMSATPVTP